MDTQNASCPRSRKILVWSFIIILGFLIVGVPSGVLSEGNEPTATNTPTVVFTLPPTDTPIPTEAPPEGAPPEGEDDVTAKDLDDTQGDIAGQAASMETEDQSQPWLSSLGTLNLCLIGLIVLAMIVVMIIVVYGIMKRIGG